MKIRVISNNSQLINQLKSAYQINTKNKPEHLYNVTEDCVVVDDTIVSLDDVLDMKTTTVPIFYVVKPHNKSEIELDQVIIVEESELLNQIQAYLGKDTTCANAFCFYGCLSGIGTTNVAISVAKEFAKKGKTCLLSLTFKPGVEYINKSESASNGGLAVLLPHLVANTLTEKELTNAIIEHEGVSYLYGIKSLFGLMEYEVQHIETLITTLAKLYDYVIIDAGGGGWISRMALAAFKTCGQNHLLVTSQPRSQQAWESIKQTVDCLDIDESFRLIISPYMRKTELMSERQIKRHYDVPYIGTLDYANGFELEAELKRKPIADLSKVVNKQIQSLVNAIE